MRKAERQESCCPTSQNHVSALRISVQCEKTLSGQALGYTLSSALSLLPDHMQIQCWFKPGCLHQPPTMSFLPSSGPVLFKGAAGQGIYLLTLCILVTTRIDSFKGFPCILCPSMLQCTDPDTTLTAAG